ncbi:histidine phosphatase family protein [Pseudomonadales bacterium]|nr:histidine phosphatase family protein [Pseudomonadales bacterium]
MKTIAILRHGEAEFAGNSDAGRVLTPRGMRNSQVAAETLAAHLSSQVSEMGPDAVFYSPFVRTHQTADAVLKILNTRSDHPIYFAAEKALLGDNTPHAVCQWLDTLPYERILLISHEPLVSGLVEWLVQGSSSASSNGVDSHPFFPSSLAILSAEVVSQGCAELVSMTHHCAK